MTELKNSKKKPIHAVYPGSFDPVTMGHLDIIKRAAALFNELTVCIMVNQNKHCLFTEEQRLEQLKKLLSPMKNVQVDLFHGLAMEYARAHHAAVLVRGLRSPADFSYEYNMTFFNNRIAPEIETVFLGSAMEYANVSSSAVRELLAFGGDITGLVPPEIEEAIIELGGKNE